MLNTSRTDTGRRRSRTGRAAVAGIAVVLALGAVSCGGSDDGLEKNAEGFKVEPASEVGPYAFTPSVASADLESAMGPAPVDGGESAQGATASCDTDKFLTELQSRPDAYREWAKVLGLSTDEVPAYIKSLKSTTLTSDTKVTNHGLRDGKAYPRASVLTKGTAVLVSVDADPDSPATTTTTAVPGAVVIVTRCKCGNPLLPPPADPEEVDEEAPVTEPPGTTPGSTPGTMVPGSTSTSAPAKSTTTTTKMGSSTTTTTSAKTTTSASTTTTADDEETTTTIDS